MVVYQPDEVRRSGDGAYQRRIKMLRPTVLCVLRPLVEPGREVHVEGRVREDFLDTRRQLRPPEETQE